MGLFSVVYSRRVSYNFRNWFHFQLHFRHTHTHTPSYPRKNQFHLISSSLNFYLHCAFCKCGGNVYFLGIVLMLMLWWYSPLKISTQIKSYGNGRNVLYLHSSVPFSIFMIHGFISRLRQARSFKAVTFAAWRHFMYCIILLRFNYSFALPLWRTGGIDNFSILHIQF